MSNTPNTYSGSTNPSYAGPSRPGGFQPTSGITNSTTSTGNYIPSAMGPTAVTTSAGSSSLNNFVRRPMYTSTATNGVYSSGSGTTYMHTLPPVTNPKRRKRKQRLFQKDIENLLFAMGDRPVLTDMLVLALEEILVEYLLDLCHLTMAYSRSQGRSRIKMNDLAFALRNDPLKLARFQYTIEQSYRIEKAKKMFEENTDAVGASVGNQDSDEEEDDEEQEKKTIKKETRGRKKRKVVGNVMFKQE